MKYEMGEPVIMKPSAIIMSNDAYMERLMTIHEVIDILHEIEDGGMAFRYDRRDLREYLLARLGVPEDQWPRFLGERKMMTEEEFQKLPHA